MPSLEMTPPEVFVIPEILESILSHLPQRDLLLAQQVCHTWHSAIKTSPTLQELLFFRSITNRGIRHRGRNHNPNNSTDKLEPQRQVNSLLAENFPAWFPHHDPDDPNDDKNSIPTATSCQRSLYSILPCAAGLEHPKFRQPKPPPPSTLSPKVEALLRPEASWRKMLVTQPPLYRYEEVHISSGRLGASFEKADCVVGDGLRMGLVYDRAQTWMETLLVPSFGCVVASLQPPPGSTRVGKNHKARGSWTPWLSQWLTGRVFGGRDRYTLKLAKVSQCSGQDYVGGNNVMHWRSEDYGAQGEVREIWNDGEMPNGEVGVEVKEGLVVAKRNGKERDEMVLDFREPAAAPERPGAGYRYTEDGFIREVTPESDDGDDLYE